MVPPCRLEHISGEPAPVVMDLQSILAIKMDPQYHNQSVIHI